MIRSLIFAVLFPLLCLLCFIAWGRTLPNVSDIFPLLLIAYAVTIWPGLILAGVDSLLARRGVRFRFVWAPVVGGLATVGAGIDDQPVAIFKPLRLGYFARGGQKMAQHCGIVRGGVGVRGEVTFGNDQHVHWGLGVDVGEGEHLLILVQPLYGDGSGGDLAEQAIGHRVLTVNSRWGRVKGIGPSCFRL